MSGPREGKLDSLQALRAFCAVGVVVHHVHSSLVGDPSGGPDGGRSAAAVLATAGAYGVDVFFVLSGFLISRLGERRGSGLRSTASFLADRWARLWPTYLLANLIFLLPSFRAVLSGTGSPPELSLHRLASVVFWPSFKAAGMLEPIVGVGWSLNYEMCFYLLYAAAVAVAGSWRGVCLALAVAAIPFLARAWNSGSALCSFLSDTVSLEFLYGLGIAAFHRRVRRLPLALVALLGGFGALGLVLGACWDGVRFVRTGFPACLLLLAFLYSGTRLRWPRWICMIGDASYFLYLFHLPALYVVLAASRRLGWERPLGIGSLALAFSLVVGLAGHRLFERPLARGWERLRVRLRERGAGA